MCGPEMHRQHEASIQERIEQDRQERDRFKVAME